MANQVAEGKRSSTCPQYDFQQLMHDAQIRWLRPAEIYEILKNYRMFKIQSEPPNRPASGSVFLFNKKVLRYFRKDGHNWRKKKDGKTIKEAHERLKAGSVELLHCYYAHGEDDENFQRRSYWMLEEELKHIVFVHYRNVKGSIGNCSRTKDVKAHLCNTQDDRLLVPSMITNDVQMPHQNASMDAESPSSAQSSEYEDSETDNYPASPRHDPFFEVPRGDLKPLADTSHVEPYVPVMSTETPGDLQGCMGLDSDFIILAKESLSSPFVMSSATYNVSNTNMDLPSDLILNYGCQPSYFQECSIYAHEDNVIGKNNARFDNFVKDELVMGNIAMHGQDGTQCQDVYMPVPHSNSIKLGKTNPLSKQRSSEFSKLDGDESLEKNDSFSRWMCRELEEVGGSCVQSNSEIHWHEFENGGVDEDSSVPHQGQIDCYILSPSLSQDQLFSIVNYQPCWGYSHLQTKVLVAGAFLRNNDVLKFQWSCMFGEIEVPAEVLANGNLQCYAPQHRAGRVPFYITCSDRLACSEVREFEYIDRLSQSMGSSEHSNKHPRNERPSEVWLQKCFMKMSSMGSVFLDHVPSSIGEKGPVCNKIVFLLRYTDDCSDLVSKNSLTQDGANDRLLIKLLKENLCSWLLHKVLEDDSVLNVLDEDGLCIIHVAAALDYDWAIEPIVTAGVGINFRDASGWSALHWAAYYGREKTVVTLISLGADPGALTDPTSEFTSGRTPADLASTFGHKGIAGFLAKSSLTSHLSALTFNEVIQSDTAQSLTTNDNFTRNTVHFNEKELIDNSSLSDSLSAVRTATQAAARIYQAFRVQSFHRKQMISYEDESTLSDQSALSLIAAKTNKSIRSVDNLHVTAATRIQNKFRGWKGRKKFLIIRQHIVKIQAHVRGYQVRKRKKILWTIGIVQKVLTWRRRGRGLSYPQLKASGTGPSISSQPSKDNDVEEEDLLKIGRKQSEVRLEKALARVKSMVQYPEARDQYRRLLTGVKEFQSKVTLESILAYPPDSVDMHVIVEIEEQIRDDVEMSLDVHDMF